MAFTPVTQKGLAQFDDLDPVVAVIKAWSIPGRFPQWHYRMQQGVRSSMPVLGRSLDRLAQNCPTCRTGMSRTTTNGVCQTCGTDHMKEM